MEVNSIPDGFTTVTPYLILRDASSAIEFYKKAFSAIEISHMESANKKIMHADIKIGNSCLMLADEFPEMGFKSPQTSGYPCLSICMLKMLITYSRKQ